MQLVEAKSLDDNVMIKKSNTNSSNDSSIENKTTATNNDADKRIVDEMILTVQGETSFEFASIQSEASILSIQVISTCNMNCFIDIYIVLQKNHRLIRHFVISGLFTF